MGMIIMNGKEYTSSPKDGFPPIIYSDEEREIGVWRDGKPLYQKTVVYGNISTGGQSITLSTGLTNIDKIFIVPSGSQFRDDLPVPYVHYSNDTIVGYFFDLNNGSPNVNIRVGSYSKANLSNTILTFQYTKTTDTPGSGKYTTYGGLAHHYSTTEQVVGTWINGKPLYEKVLIPTGLSTDTADEDFAISNVDEIISCDGRISNTSNTLCTTTPFIVNNEYRCGFQANVLNSTTVRCRSYYGSQSSSYRIKAIILKYTKTTD